ncbi:MAG TPA: bifunctional 2-C-methyl-D-erythritol 4-phosphate cytidylyltransferase/2-C-methyl-D-erythritol 2,4-cyclodiphosphate synthase [Caulobacteraceae bacterium]|jgi:2-C-methyl-D-erythritol 4-phosphate cytidylyltransferase/2-C-methyl-D-erythritol 2,4-cyclodiphosphate synthase
MRFAAVILAAGSGQRAGPGEAKQWRLLGGKPVLRWSAEALAAAGADTLVIVSPPGEEQRAAAAAEGLGARVVEGGARRADSSRGGLAALSAAEIEAVLIHDAARPFVSSTVVKALLAALETHDGAIPVLPLADTLRRAGGSGPVDRTGLLRVQTPQAFRFPAIHDAFARLDPGADPTDDAAVLEAAGGAVATVPGDPMLMKLTYAEDFALAERLAGAQRITRVGQGFDVHRFGPGDAVWLCGVRIPLGHGLVGHSDADVGLHALTDALLGAIGAGDIGQHFPPSDPQWRGAASDRFVRHALQLIRSQGAEVLNADITLICEVPKVGPHREAMRASLAELLDLPPSRVSVKATTTEGLGFIGRGEGVAAQAIVAVEAPR